MRITQSTVVNQFLYNLQQTEQQLLKTQNEISSGKRVMLPEDDPAAAARSLQLQSSIDATSQYLTNDTQAKSWIQATDSALQSADSIMQQVRNLVLQANSGAETPDDLTAVATTAASLQQELVNVANSQVNGEYLFAGQKISTQPYVQGSTTFTYGTTPLQVAGTTYTYQGDSGAIEREISPSVHIQVNTAGNVFQSALNDVSQMVADLKHAAGSTDPNQDLNNNLPTDLGNLDKDLSSLQTAEAETGATLQRIASNDQRLQDLKTNLQTWLAGAQDLDVASATVKLQQEQTAYQEALAVGARLQQTTLLNYLQP